MKQLSIIVCALLLGSFRDASATDAKHDLFGLMPGIKAADAARLLTGLHFKCGPRMPLYYDHTSKDTCTTEYTDLRSLQIIYAAALPNSPIISITASMDRHEPAEATLKDISQQFGRGPNEISNDNSGGQVDVWNLEGGYRLTLWGRSLILEKDEIRNQNKEAWSPRANPAPKF
jgi:hypothetical protein